MFILLKYKILNGQGGSYAVNITKEMTMGELLSIDRGVAVVLMNAGMHCIGCPSSIGESLEEACMVHGIEVDGLLKNINEYFANK